LLLLLATYTSFTDYIREDICKDTVVMFPTSPNSVATLSYETGNIAIEYRKRIL